MTQSSDSLLPFHVFRFRVDFYGQDEAKAIASAQFSECTGLEATMEPKVIKEGGRNFAPLQRVGPVSFATVILKRGITRDTSLWSWFARVGGGQYAYRMNVGISLLSPIGNAPDSKSKDPEEIMIWELDPALPVKFKSADMNAKASEVGIEEAHLVHEGMRLVT